MNMLERLKELSQQATPGPWEIKRTDVGDEFVCMVPSRIDGPGATVVDDDGGMCPYNEEWEAKTLEANAELIVTLRNNAEALIEVAEAAWKALFVESKQMQDWTGEDIALYAALSQLMLDDQEAPHD